MCLCIPTHDQSQTKRLRLNKPFHVELRLLTFGKARDDGLKITILAGLEALAVLTKRVDHTWIEAGFAPHQKKAAMAVNVAQRGQSKIAPVSQE